MMARSFILCSVTTVVPTASLSRISTKGFTTTPYTQALDLCQRRLEDKDATISLAAVPSLLSEAFEADFQQVLSTPTRRVLLSNVSCLIGPEGRESSGLKGTEIAEFQEQCFKVSGRGANGECTCSRVSYAGLASAEECAELRSLTETWLAEGNGDFDDDGYDEEEGFVADVYVSEAVEAGNAALALLMLRLIERLRRVVAHEYGLPRDRLTTSRAFVARIKAAADGIDAVPSKSGDLGDGPQGTEAACACYEEGDGTMEAPLPPYGLPHADVQSFPSFEYSAVLHLQSVGEGFDGGGFVFMDPVAQTDGRAEADRTPAPRHRLTRLTPQAGRAILFSSGWENVHYVEPCRGERFALITFFESTPEVLSEAEGTSHSIRDLCARWEGV